MVIFPDIEKTLVSYLKAALTAQNTTLASNVKVATKKVAPDATQPAKQVVVNAAYNGEITRVTKTASLTLDIYADDYSTASSLGLLVEALIRGVVGDPIKRAEVIVGPVRMAEETEQEKRSIDVQLVVKGSEL